MHRYLVFPVLFCWIPDSRKWQNELCCDVLYGGWGMHLCVHQFQIVLQYTSLMKNNRWHSFPPFYTCLCSIPDCKEWMEKTNKGFVCEKKPVGENFDRATAWADKWISPTKGRERNRLQGREKDIKCFSSCMKLILSHYGFFLEACFFLEKKALIYSRLGTWDQWEMDDWWENENVDNRLEMFLFFASATMYSWAKFLLNC